MRGMHEKTSYQRHRFAGACGRLGALSIIAVVGSVGLTSVVAAPAHAVGLPSASSSAPMWWEGEETPAATVTFRANGGTGSMASQSSSVSAPLSANTLTRSGYRFARWNTAADGSGTSYSDRATYRFSTNATLYAQWVRVAIMVSYDVGGAAGTAPETQAVGSESSAVTVASAAGLTRSGYRFAGWNTAADGSGMSYAAGASFSPSVSAVLYAQWVPGSYAVTYSAGAGTGVVPVSQTFTTGGDPLVVSSGSGLTRPGYVFSGWNTAASGHGVSYAAGASLAPTVATVLTAQWVAGTYTLTYDLTAGTGTIPASQTYSTGDESALTVARGTGIARPGYLFAGWNTAVDGSGTSFAMGSSIAPTVDTTLFAKWLPGTYAVTYDGNGGAGATPAAQTYTTGEGAAVAASGASLSHSGATFAGWNTAANGSGIAYAAGQTLSPTAATVLYAQWNALAAVEESTSSAPVTQSPGASSSASQGSTSSAPETGSSGSSGSSGASGSSAASASASAGSVTQTSGASASASGAPSTAQSSTGSGAVGSATRLPTTVVTPSNPVTPGVTSVQAAGAATSLPKTPPVNSRSGVAGGAAKGTEAKVAAPASERLAALLDGTVVSVVSRPAAWVAIVLALASILAGVWWFTLGRRRRRRRDEGFEAFRP